MTDDARRTHWYANSSLWPFGPGQLIIIHTKFQAPEPSSSVVEDFLYILFLNPRPLLQDQPGPGKCGGGGGASSEQTWYRPFDNASFQRSKTWAF